MINKEIINLDNLNISEKVNLINDIGLNVDKYLKPLEILRQLSEDESDEVRWTAAEILFNFKNITAEKILLKLMSDPNEVVRVCACESLSNGQTMKTLLYLKERFIKDKSSLVRGYAAGSIVEVAKRRSNILDLNLVRFLEDRLQIERSSGVKIRIYEALFNYGEEKYFYLLLNEINNKNYRNRCVVVNIMGDLISDENKTIILPILQKRFVIEKTKAVKSLIENILEKFVSGKK
jgi:HEAT repeat protein